MDVMQQNSAVTLLRKKTFAARDGEREGKMTEGNVKKNKSKSQEKEGKVMGQEINRKTRKSASPCPWGRCVQTVGSGFPCGLPP